MYQGREQSSYVGAWYNNWGDLWGDVEGAGKWLINQGRNVQDTGTAVQNAGNNIANATSWRLDGFTVVAGALGLGALYAITRGRRR